MYWAFVVRIEVVRLHPLYPTKYYPKVYMASKAVSKWRLIFNLAAVLH